MGAKVKTMVRKGASFQEKLYLIEIFRANVSNGQLLNIFFRIFVRKYSQRYISIADNTNRFATVNNRQMTNPPGFHQFPGSHEFFIKTNADWRWCHDIPDCHLTSHASLLRYYCF